MLKSKEAAIYIRLQFEEGKERAFFVNATKTVGDFEGLCAHNDSNE